MPSSYAVSVEANYPVYVGETSHTAGKYSLYVFNALFFVSNCKSLRCFHVKIICVSTLILICLKENIISS